MRLEVRVEGQHIFREGLLDLSHAVRRSRWEIATVTKVIGDGEESGDVANVLEDDISRLWSISERRLDRRFHRGEVREVGECLRWLLRWQRRGCWTSRMVARRTGRCSFVKGVHPVFAGTTRSESTRALVLDLMRIETPFGWRKGCCAGRDSTRR